jgi:hypothetical protein
MSQFYRGLSEEGVPVELLDAHMLRVLGIPLATGWAGLQDVPAQLVDDTMILLAGREDADEWTSMDMKKAASGRN